MNDLLDKIHELQPRLIGMTISGAEKLAKEENVPIIFVIYNYEEEVDVDNITLIALYNYEDRIVDTTVLFGEEDGFGLFA